MPSVPEVMLRPQSTVFLTMVAGCLVQTNGVGWLFHSAMSASMWRMCAQTGSKEPQRTDFRVRTPNYASTMLSQDAPFGVK
jgi:hypothetical protein